MSKAVYIKTILSLASVPGFRIRLEPRITETEERSANGTNTPKD